MALWMNVVPINTGKSVWLASRGLGLAPNPKVWPRETKTRPLVWHMVSCTYFQGLKCAIITTSSIDYYTQ